MRKNRIAAIAAVMLLLAVTLVAISPQLIPEAHAARTRRFTEDFNAYSDTWWTTWQGTPVIEDGALKFQPLRIHGAIYTKYANMTVRAKVSATITAGSPTLGLITNFSTPDDQDDSIIVFFFPGGNMYAESRKAGQTTQINLGAYAGNTWYKFEIIWDATIVKFYVDDVYKGNSTTNIIDTRAKIWLSHADSAEALYIDYVYIDEDLVTNYPTPQICYGNTTTWINPSWTEGNKTLWASMTGSGTYVYKIYVPSTYAQYFAEIKKDGSPWTNISFSMATRELSIKGLTGTVVSAAFVDPPQILVNLYYWLLGFGISIAPLLKLWDKLAAIHKLLPYVVLAVAVAFLVVAAWYAWQFYSAWRLR